MKQKKNKKYETIIEHYDWELEEEDIFDFAERLLEEPDSIIELEEIYSGYFKDEDDTEGTN